MLAEWDFRRYWTAMIPSVDRLAATGMSFQQPGIGNTGYSCGRPFDDMKNV
jgi:hypothetical protein